MVLPLGRMRYPEDLERLFDAGLIEDDELFVEQDSVEEREELVARRLLASNRCSLGEAASSSSPLS